MPALAAWSSRRPRQQLMTRMLLMQPGWLMVPG
jgi:hypothetical protein